MPSLTLPRHTAKNAAPPRCRATPPPPSSGPAPFPRRFALALADFGSSSPSAALNSAKAAANSFLSRGSTTACFLAHTRSQTLGVPWPRQNSTHARITPYEGKNTSSPSGTTRAKLTMAFPSSALYSSVSRNR